MLAISFIIAKMYGQNSLLNQEFSCKILWIIVKITEIFLVKLGILANDLYKLILNPLV